MASLLLYHLYPRTIWKELTDTLLSDVPHDEIIIHIALPKRKAYQYFSVRRHCRSYEKVTAVYVSLNSRKKGEAKGFNILRRKVDFSGYDIVSYMHSKGASRKRKLTGPMRDWTEFMRHFIVDRFDLCLEAFTRGYDLYGVNLSEKVYAKPDQKLLFPECKFIYQGNFVTVNLKNLRQEFLTKSCIHHYYSLERFWGTLCPIEKAYSAFQSGVNHYTDPFPASKYREI